MPAIRRFTATLCLSLLGLSSFAPPPAQSQASPPCITDTAPPLTLGASGNDFTFNGSPRFLLCASYFGGLGASEETIRSDFQALSQKGFNCVRIWANWYYEDITPDVPEIYRNRLLFDRTGAINPPNMTRLKNLIRCAEYYGLVVDVTFTRDTLARMTNGGPPVCMTFSAYKAGIQASAQQLASFENVLFDLQNESNHYTSNSCGEACGPCTDCDQTDSCREYYVSPSEGAQLADAVRDIDPNRLVTVSVGGNVDTLAQFVNAGNLDIGAFHCCPGDDWDDDTGPAVQAVRAALGNGIPIYFQETPRCDRNDECDAPGAADLFVNAARNARNAGAAGWTFHNGSSFNLTVDTLMEQLSAAELDAVNRLAGAVGLCGGSGAPNLLSPANEAWTVATPTLTWSPVTNPPTTQYRLEIRRASNLNVVYNPTLGNVTSHVVPAGKLLDDVRYLWRVRACNTGGCGPWSCERSLTPRAYVQVDLGIADIDYGLTPVEPADGKTVWTKITNACNGNGVHLKKNRGTATTPTSRYFYFQVDDRFAKNGSQKRVEFAVKYWDSNPPGSGWSEEFRIEYHAVGNVYKQVGTTTVGNTNCMKRMTVAVDDAYFGNGQTGGADFRIWAGTGDTRRFIDVVSVKKN